MKILLAEDDPAMRRLVSETLRGVGHVVEEVVDGGRLLVALTRALRVDAEHASIDLVLTDIRMPVVTGLSLAATFRSARRRIPIVLMTAFPDDAVRREAGALGLPLLEKPFDGESLLRVVEQAFDEARERERSGRA